MQVSLLQTGLEQPLSQPDHGTGERHARPIVLADEIRSGLLQTAPFTLDTVEPFYAVSVPRNYPHPILADLLKAGSLSV